jgi:hypothetical protein
MFVMPFACSWLGLVYFPRVVLRLQCVELVHGLVLALAVLEEIKLRTIFPKPLISCSIEYVLALCLVR